MRYRYIQGYHGCPVKKLCRVLRVTRSGYYAWLEAQRSPTPRQVRDELNRERIRKVMKDSHWTYGVRRIHRKLPDLSKRTIWRLMRKYGLHVRTAGTWHPRTTNSNHSLPVFENLLGQSFHAERPNTVWVSDITYIRVGATFIYLAIVLDLYDRKIVGWALSRSIDAALVVTALRTAIIRRKPPPGLIVHSDRGSQYASLMYRELLGERFLGSMSRKGDPYDNACAEAFFHTLKTEWLSFERFTDFDEAYTSLYYYIELFYNRVRLHSAIGYVPPHTLAPS